MKVTIRELQKIGYRKTVLIGLFLSNKGKAYNYITKRECKPTASGYITFNGKTYNLAKMLLETFKKESVRAGKILFLNGNSKDFDINNISYAVGTHYTAPSEASLINCIRLYFEIPKKLTRHDIFFKDYLNRIVHLRGFICSHEGNDFNLFLEWLKPFTQSRSKAQVSVKNGYTIVNGTNAINKYLSLLVNECLKDQEAYILKINDFSPKPLTAIQKLKIANETLLQMRLTARIPLRKPKN
ncbi:hypothetical protein [Flavobacterium chilense]|uniref:Uncharacterized protein n=1 Tax=Flavobacterium chilense TaxID=946677 RepID=A0A1M7DQF0_9FLAO|nr:hypothetical protein [Flavobacterium chilense]SHL81712.1 hypothetical protein SAMN05444484_102678 [Flavobacterium chilense]